MVNIGSLDRNVRLVLGAALLALAFLPPLASFYADWSLGKLVFAAIGLILAGTAIFRFCPAYALFGLRTCPIKKS